MNLLNIKKQMKAKKPHFKRTNFWKKKLRATYRKPRGIHNKMRLKKASHLKRITPGYRTPRKIRHYTREGLKERLIFNEQEINTLTKNEIAVIASQVGMKTKIKILEKAKENNIQIGNVKDIDAFIAKWKEEKQKKKQETQKKEEKKEKTKEEALKKTTEAKKEEKTHEEKKEEEEELKKKILQQERTKPKQEAVTKIKPHSEIGRQKIIPAGDKK
ncbi:hypothetical protein HYT51_01950 [Candidatus Woesearchaeota archaeon]|nr:hypothetical protein [Candidatus Woesearchaeota archaeon]